MKPGIILITIFCSILYSNANAEDKYDTLQRKIDSLEARMTNIVNGQVLNDSDHVKKVPEWGTGFFAGAKTGTHYTVNLEAGYFFRKKRNSFAPLSREYIGKRNDYRFGISAGMQLVYKEPVHKGRSTFYTSTCFGPFMKLNFCSPVLLNFISISGHVKAMCAFPAENSRHTITDPRLVLGFGNDIEFWLSENACVTLGYTDECDIDIGGDTDGDLYPSKIRFVFGTKTFIRKRKNNKQ